MNNPSGKITLHAKSNQEGANICSCHREVYTTCVLCTPSNALSATYVKAL